MSGNGSVGASYGDLLVMSLVVLGGVCIAAFVVVRVVGRFLATGRTRGSYLLDVVARLPLEPRRSLYVVEVAGKTLLVGTSEMGLSVLSELDGDEVRARVALRPSFGELVRSAWQRRRGLAQPLDEDRSGDRRDANALHSHEAQPPVAAPPSEQEPRDAPRMGEPAPDTGPRVDEVR